MAKDYANDSQLSYRPQQLSYSTKKANIIPRITQTKLLTSLPINNSTALTTCEIITHNQIRHTSPKQIRYLLYI